MKISIEIRINNMATSNHEYRELCEEYRTVLRLFWEIPHIVIAIVSGLLIGSYGFIPKEEHGLLRVFLLFLSSSMLGVAFLSAWKHRKFGYSYVEVLKKYDEIPRCTLELRKWIENQKKQSKLLGCCTSSLKWNEILNIRVQKIFLVLLLDTLFAFISLAVVELLALMEIKHPTWHCIINPPQNLLLCIGILLVINTAVYRHLD
jgi:hypothetical protein